MAKNFSILKNKLFCILKKTWNSQSSIYHMLIIEKTTENQRQKIKYRKVVFGEKATLCFKQAV